MNKDPNMIWDNEFPYDVLKPAGVTTNSSMGEITNAMKYFIEHGNIENVHQVWQTMQTVKGRLFVDFFLYRLYRDVEE